MLTDFACMQIPAGGGAYKYDFMCSGVHAPSQAEITAGAEVGWGESHRKYTKWQTNGQWNVAYLDRQDVDCGFNAAIASFKLEYKGDQLRYNYQCVKPISGTLYCETRETPGNERKRDNVAYLDRHWVDCGPDKVLQQFKLQTWNNGGDKMNYKFKCCWNSMELKDTYPEQKCHMPTCSVKAKEAHSGGFCLQNGGDCWWKEGTNADQFSLAAMSSGQWTGSTKCDTENEGVWGTGPNDPNKKMMPCYEFERKDEKWATPIIRFDNYESLRKAVTGLTSWTWYAWRMSGLPVPSFVSRKCVLARDQLRVHWPLRIIICMHRLVH
jgi:hypothetical protein